MFSTYVHIYSSPLHQTQSLTWSLKSNQDYTFHSVFLFSLPILFEDISVLHTYPVHQMIFDCSLAGGTGSFVAVTGAEAAESFVSQQVDCFVIGDIDGFVAVGIVDSVAEGFVLSWDEGLEGAFLADFVDCHPNPLWHVLYFCKWGSAVP